MDESKIPELLVYYEDLIQKQTDAMALMTQLIVKQSETIAQLQGVKNAEEQKD